MKISFPWKLEINFRKSHSISAKIFNCVPNTNYRTFKQIIIGNCSRSVSKCTFSFIFMIRHLILLVTNTNIQMMILEVIATTMFMKKTPMGDASSCEDEGGNDDSAPGDSAPAFDNGDHRVVRISITFVVRWLVRWLVG